LAHGMSVASGCGIARRHGRARGGEWRRSHRFGYGIALFHQSPGAREGGERGGERGGEIADEGGEHRDGDGARR
jgi:hypothetical protein